MRGSPRGDQGVQHLLQRRLVVLVRLVAGTLVRKVHAAVPLRAADGICTACHHGGFL